MKTFKTILLAFVAIGIATSCGSDDDAAPAQFELTNANLAGTYDVVFYEEDTMETQDVNGSDINTTITVEGATFTNAQFVFNQNGSYTTSGRYVENSTTRVDNNPPQSDSEIVDLDFSGSYQLNDMNSMISITDRDGDLISGRVTNFTETGFRIILEDNVVDQGFSSMSTIEYRFERQ